MSTPFFTPSAAWSAPAAVAGRVRHAAATGRWDTVSVDAVAGSSLQRDVAIAELLKYSATDGFAARVAVERAHTLYSWHPSPFTASVGAAVGAHMDSEGNYGLAAAAAAGDALARHIDRVRHGSGDRLGPLADIAVGELTATTALRFTVDDPSGNGPLVFDAVGYDQPWNGFASPLVDQQTLEAFMAATGQALEPQAPATRDDHPAFATWTTIDQAAGAAPDLGDRDRIMPTAEGLYVLSGYILTSRAGEIDGVDDLWRAVDTAVHAADQDQRSGFVGMQPGLDLSAGAFGPGLS